MKTLGITSARARIPMQLQLQIKPDKFKLD